MDGRTHARTDNVKTVYPTTNKVCGGYNDNFSLILQKLCLYRVPLIYFKISDIGQTEIW